MRVLIVGAGPTGLTAAIELMRLGVRAVVIDRKEAPSTLSRAVGILPSSLKTLAASGVTERLIAEGVKLQELRAYVGEQKALTVSLAGAHPEHDYGIALAQDRTEHAMRDAFSKLGGAVNYGTELTGLRPEGERVVAQTGDGREERWDYLIGADGIRSAAREALKMEFAGYDLPETWSIADVEAEGWMNPESFTFCLLPKGGIVVVVPLERERYRVIANREDAVSVLPLELNIGRIRREGSFRIAIRQVAEYRAGCVYLAGDAAHCHSPVGGRGMNLGIADAAELARRLVEGRLEGYSASRHAVGKETIALSERARRLVTSTGFFKRSLLNMGLRVANSVPAFQRRVARQFLDG